MNLNGLGALANGFFNSYGAMERIQHQKLQDAGNEAFGKTLASMGINSPPPANPLASSMGPPATGAPPVAATLPSGPAPSGGPAEPFDFNKAAAAKSSVESTNNYQAVGSKPDKHGDYAYGKYQVMGANIPSWTKAVTGHAMTPQQFLANPQVQDAVFRKYYGGYYNKYGSYQAADSMWFTGKPPSPATMGLHDALGTTNAAYIRKSQAARRAQGMAPQQGQAPQQAAQEAPQAQGGPLTLQQVAGMIRKANPGASPAVIAVAMEHALPYMNQQSQMAYHQVMLQLAAARQDEVRRHQQAQEQQAGTTEADRNAHYKAQDTLSKAKIGLEAQSAAQRQTQAAQNAKALQDYRKSRLDYYKASLGQRSAATAAKMAQSDASMKLAVERLHMAQQAFTLKQGAAKAAATKELRLRLNNASTAAASFANTYGRLVSSFTMTGRALTPDQTTMLAQVKAQMADAVQAVKAAKTALAAGSAARSAYAPAPAPAPSGLPNAPRPPMGQPAPQAPVAPAMAAPAQAAPQPVPKLAPDGKYYIQVGPSAWAVVPPPAQ